MLAGREAECAALDRLVAQARAGRSGCLVLAGPPGGGKSALLRHAVTTAGGLAVLRATGVPAEQQLPFAGLHQLLHPVLHRLDGLPGPQRDALAAALALDSRAAGDPGGRFAVAAAVLTLFAECADPAGLLVAVDDAHWLDHATVDALRFTARRLHADGVLLLLAARTGESADLDDGDLPVLPLDGLPASAARDLLAARSGGPVAEPVAAALAERTGGNPLALTELAGLLDAEQLAGRALLPDVLPVGAGIERAFLARVRARPAAEQELLLVAAADGGGDPRAVLDAAHRLGVAPAALDGLEAADLLAARGGRLEFRHPLVRSAVYGAAGPAQRRTVHRALADTLTADPDRRAWHRAAATATVDDAVAADLAGAADRARRRGAYASAAACLHRAAELTADPERRARWLVEGAGNAWLAGQPDRAGAALDEAEPLSADPGLRATASHLRGRFALRQGVASEAYRLLTAGADAAAAHDPAGALRMLAEAAEAASFVGDTAAIVATGPRAAAIEPAGDGGFWRDLCLGWAGIYAGTPAAAAAPLTRVVDALPGLTDPYRLVQAATAATYLGRAQAASAALDRAAQAARVGAMTGDLPHVLLFQAAVEESRGRYATAQALAEEGLALADETGQVSFSCLHRSTLATLAAVRGDAEACERHAARVLDDALPRRLGLPAARAGLALAMLDLGAGRYPAALARFGQLAQAPPGFGHPGVPMGALGDWIEAAVRAGDEDQARRQLAVLEALAAAADALPRAVLLCCRALLAGPDAGERFEEALALHRSTGAPPPYVARTHLLYGEWLRRSRQRSRARDHLRAALDLYERLGARPWADRARTELRASGETLRRADAAAGPRLTPQELRVTRSVLAGQSTKDIAALLFLSPRTVEYHVQKVFTKLGVSSRAALVRAVTDRPELVDQAG